MKWAENHIKLSHARANIKRYNAMNGAHPMKEDEETLMKEYIKGGGRVVHPVTGEIVDNNVGATRDERGQITERDPSVYEAKVPELIKAYKDARVQNGDTKPSSIVTSKKAK